MSAIVSERLRVEFNADPGTEPDTHDQHDTSDLQGTHDVQDYNHRF
jgi:hypothetical protein